MQQGFWALIAVAMTAAVATTGCASTAPKKATSAVAEPATPASSPPAWFVKRRGELKDAAYPKLADVPEAPKADRTANDWQTLETAIKQAGAKLMADPNNIPAKIEDLAEFEAKARAAATPPPAKP
jgi:hypothetical protein